LTDGKSCRDIFAVHRPLDLLTSCHEKSIELANQNSLASIAFPAISTGVFGYPVGAAARIAVETVARAVNQNSTIEQCIFCCFSRGDYEIYFDLIEKLYRV
jgi:O-acetyl-ADP-ribose deacetylase (regulator of RNase III)